MIYRLWWVSTLKKRNNRLRRCITQAFMRSGSGIAGEKEVSVIDASTGETCSKALGTWQCSQIEKRLYNVAGRQGAQGTTLCRKSFGAWAWRARAQRRLGIKGYLSDLKGMGNLYTFQDLSFETNSTTILWKSSSQGREQVYGAAISEIAQSRTAT